VKTLRGRNAILTGGSRGLGPIVGGALAREGVNLVLVARSRGLLEEEASKLASQGGQAVAIPADISDPDSRVDLLRRAEAALGPIDILVNNAAIEETTRFDRQSPESVVRTIETNLIAPMLLIRELLPAMLERGTGHIVNMASMSGKKGLPYGATYAASKAGIIEWTQAMRFELEGTGVGASVVVPGFVTDAGKFASYGLQAPRLAGASSPEQVAEAVVRAIRHDLQEVLVNPGPTRLFLALNALSPALGNALYRRMGVVDMLRPLAESEATNL
jgi:short-subunit dehydrogenase